MTRPIAALRRGLSVRAAWAAATVAWSLAVLPPLAAAPPSVTLVADDVTVDNTGTTIVASGHVAAGYGGLRIASDGLRVLRATGTATFTGHVSMVEGLRRAAAETAIISVAHESQVTRVVLAGRASVETPAYALHGDRIVADRPSGRLAALGHVTILARPDVVVTGAAATYDQGTDHAVVRGDAGSRATIRNRDGRLSGASLEVWRKTGDAVVHGPVRAEIDDASLRGDTATIHLEQGTAVIAGHVTASRRQGTLLADRLTVDYRARRFVAEGATHLSLIDGGEVSTPRP